MVIRVHSSPWPLRVTIDCPKKGGFYKPRKPQVISISGPFFWTMSRVCLYLYAWKQQMWTIFSPFCSPSGTSVWNVFHSSPRKWISQLFQYLWEKVEKNLKHIPQCQTTLPAGQLVALPTPPPPLCLILTHKTSSVRCSGLSSKSCARTHLVQCKTHSVSIYNKELHITRQVRIAHTAPVNVWGWRREISSGINGQLTQRCVVTKGDSESFYVWQPVMLSCLPFAETSFLR